MTHEQRRTVVIGGGVIGAFAAYFLEQTGRKVTIVDKGEFGKGCSHGNCGYVSPSHVMPLQRPGQLMNGLKGLFSSQHALRIRPQWSLSFWAWMLKFASRCNPRAMLEAGAARHALLQSAASLYREIIDREKLAVDWQPQGLLFVFRDQHGFDEYREADAWLRSNFGVAARMIEGSDALTALEPALKPGLAGAWLYEIDAHLRPDRLMSELKRILSERGVRMIEACEVKAFDGAGGQARAARTSQQDIEADEFVVCTGAWTPFLNDQIGCKIPIHPGKGYSITMPRPVICPRYSMILEECHVGITPFEDGYRIGSTMEFAGYDATLDRRRLDYLRKGAAEYLHEPAAEPVEEEWCGWRPMTWDDNPYVDRSPRFRNVWVAAGHNMLGLSMGPATGRLLAEMVENRTPHIDPRPYRIGR